MNIAFLLFSASSRLIAADAFSSDRAARYTLAVMPVFPPRLGMSRSGRKGGGNMRAIMPPILLEQTGAELSVCLS
ncbi:hypothetical protein DFH06DRAFT_1248149 [Mycena polygramma]|nr:hypothetical protein DFH06DRAFT_1248149 [Mycena polygramma]